MPPWTALPFRSLSLRYLAVGAAVNGFGYLAYLTLTTVGFSPRMAVTTLFPVSLLAAFQGHAKFTFVTRRSSHPKRQAAVRYVLVTFAGYVMNLALLGVLVDLLGVPHQLGQLVALAAIVPISFVLLRRVVFQPAERAI